MCGINCGADGCARARVDGDIQRTQALVATWGSKEKSAKIRNDLANALVWDGADGDWRYRLTLNLKPVCIRIWAEGYAIKRSSLYRYKRSTEDAADARRRGSGACVVSENVRAAERRRGPSSHTGRALAWLDAFAFETGEKLPVPARQALREGDVDEAEEEQMRGEIRLPFTMKGDVFAEYVASCALDGDGTHVSRSHFYRSWKANRRHIRCAQGKGTFAMCDVCGRLTSQIKLASSNAEADRVRAERGVHLNLQRKQRAVYYANRSRAITNKRQYLSLIIDAMDQKKTQLPLMNRRQKSDNIQLIKQKVMGVIAHGIGSYLYVGLPPLATGANFTLECLWRTLMKLDAEYRRSGDHMPRHISVQMDNASDNKAFAVLSFAAHLVEAGVCDTVELNFLMVGHTHEDIDQLFSVISRRFKRLVFGTRDGVVVSFEDFHSVVLGAFGEKHAPRCVERVVVNHDFTAWLAPFRDERVSGITRFRSFTFRMQTPDEIAVRDDRWARFDGRAVMLAKEYMSDPETKCKPSQADRDRYGPLVMLRKGEVHGEPQVEEYRDLARPTRTRDGGVKEVPTAFRDKTSSEILELQKATWRAWVQSPAHGASPVQQQQFEGLLHTMRGSTAALPLEILAAVPIWAMPVPADVGGQLPVVEVHMQLVLDAPPSPRLGYGDLTLHQAGAAARRHAERVVAHAEIEESRGTMGAIEKGDLLLIKTVAEDSEEEEVWLGKAEEALEECARDDKRGQMVRVHWYYGTTTGRERSEPGDLNARFHLWFRKPQGARGRKNEKVVEDTARTGIMMIGVSLTGSGTIKATSKKAIGDLRVGYVYERSSNKLVYILGAVDA